jgi:sulfur relay (sulfurtransferase) DsrF/TusC family protein
MATSPGIEMVVIAVEIVDPSGIFFVRDWVSSKSTEWNPCYLAIRQYTQTAVEHLYSQTAIFYRSNRLAFRRLIFDFYFSGLLFLKQARTIR